MRKDVAGSIGQRITRCARVHLLPEQESTIDSANQLLAEVRAALAQGDVAHAATLARNAESCARGGLRLPECA